MENKTIVLEREFNVVISDLWEAITDKDEMKIWYFDLEEFKPEVGFKFEFTGGPEDGIQYIHQCEIIESIPNKKLTYSWKYKGFEGCSYLTFELFEIEKNKTLLRLTHKDIETFPHDNPDFSIDNFEMGWDQIINISLKNYLG